MIYDKWNDPASACRIKIIFEHKRKEYGAYELRLHYRKRLVISFIASALFLFSAVIIPFIYRILNKEILENRLKQAEVFVLSNPPPVDKSDPPPLPASPPPSIQQTIKFIPPIVIDKEAVEEELPPQEKMEQIQAGTQTQEGTTERIPPPENSVVPEQPDDKIFTFVEEMPSFPGGVKKMLQFLQSDLQYPDFARENGIEGRVYVKFMVDKEGKIRNAEILKGIGYGCDEEALRVINKMPDWLPGKQNGTKVKVGGMTLYITFKLN
ncbi:MAG: energy transducer TonB [Bacteroidia bacterium]